MFAPRRENVRARRWTTATSEVASVDQWQARMSIQLDRIARADYSKVWRPRSQEKTVKWVHDFCPLRTPKCNYCSLVTHCSGKKKNIGNWVSLTPWTSVADSSGKNAGRWAIHFRVFWPRIKTGVSYCKVASEATEIPLSQNHAPKVNAAIAPFLTKIWSHYWIYFKIFVYLIGFLHILAQMSLSECLKMFCSKDKELRREINEVIYIYEINKS